jgi:hypothetical protein
MEEETFIEEIGFCRKEDVMNVASVRRTTWNAYLDPADSAGNGKTIPPFP